MRPVAIPRLLAGIGVPVVTIGVTTPGVSPRTTLPDISGAEHLHTLWHPGVPVGHWIGHAGVFGAERLIAPILPASCGPASRRGGGDSGGSGGDAIERDRRPLGRRDWERALAIVRPLAEAGDAPSTDVAHVARAAYTIVSIAAHTAGLQFKKRYHDRPNKFWAALQLLAMEVPKSIVECQCLDWRPRAGSHKLLGMLKTLLAHEGVRDAMAAIDRIGLRTFMTEAGLVTDRNADELETAECVIAGAKYVEATIAAGWEGAKASDDMFVGPEVEFLSHRRIPGLRPFTADSRDAVFQKMADAYRAAGYPVTLVKGDATFNFPPNAYVFPMIYDTFHYGGRTVRLMRLHGTGGVLMSLDDFRDFPLSDPDCWTAEDADNATVFSVETGAYERVATKIGLGTADEVRALKTNGPEQYTAEYTLMVKAEKGDIAYFRIVLTGQGTAEVHPLNGWFDGTTQEERSVRVVTAWDFKEAMAGALEMLKRTTVHKRDTIVGLDVQGVGRILIQYEQFPLLEFVGPKTRPRHLRHLLPAWQALEKARYVGTSNRTAVGVHMHMNMPARVMTPDGSELFSVAPLLAVAREYLTHARLIQGIIPTHHARRGFIRSIPPVLRQRLLDPALVTDPTDPKEILCLIAMIVGPTRAKYMELNFDNWMSYLLGHMLREGRFRDLFDAQGRLTVTWHGESYEFRIDPTKDFAGARPEELQIMLWKEGQATKLIRTVPDPSIDGWWKTTAELRIFDTVHSNPHPDEYRIDPKAIGWFARFAAAFGWLHGNANFVRARPPRTRRPPRPSGKHSAG